MSPRVVAWTVIVMMVAAAGVAAADDLRAAGDAFARAQKLALDGKPGEAADFFELADELAPSAPALRNAARARLAAGHVAMAATNAAELLRRYPDDSTSRSIAEVILAEVGPKVARIAVSCPGGCTVLLDGKPAARHRGDRQVFFAGPGRREIVAVFGDDRRANKRVTARAGSQLSLVIEPPPGAPPAAVRDAEVAPPRRRDRGGISRVWFFGGAVLTAGLGAAATYEGLATLDDRDRIRDLVAAGDAEAAASAYDEGRDRQRLTNILIGATAVAGVATITAAIFTRWSASDEDQRVTIVPVPDGAWIGYARSF